MPYSDIIVRSPTLQVILNGRLDLGRIREAHYDSDSEVCSVP